MITLVIGLNSLMITLVIERIEFFNGHCGEFFDDHLGDRKD